MAVELLLYVGSRGQKKDGMVIAVKPEGVSWTPGELNQWVTNGTEPSNLSTLNHTRRQFWRRWTRETNYLLNQFEEVDAAQRYYGLGSTQPTARQIAEVTDIRDRRQEQTDRVVANGFLDSNWGWGDLRAHACLQMDINYTDAVDFLSPVDRADGNPFSRNPYVAFRSVILDWRNLPGATAQLISDIEDPDTVLQPSRFRARLFTRPEVRGVVSEILTDADLPA